MTTLPAPSGQAPPGASDGDPSTGADPAVDTETLRQLRDDVGGRPGLDRLVAAFLRELPARRSAVARAVRERDPAALRFAAHTLKSSAALLGAADLAAICRSLEDMAGVGTPDHDIAAVAARFDAECGRVDAALASLPPEPDQLPSASR